MVFFKSELAPLRIHQLMQIPSLEAYYSAVENTAVWPVGVGIKETRFVFSCQCDTLFFIEFVWILSTGSRI